MRQAYTRLPVYAGDVSGVCSALFELGGMVVIHDPSGCNSTYNTHDEVRWYDHDSLIFISGLTDVDAILSNDEKLVDDVVQAVEETHPRFVALVNSPVPYQLGMDFDALAREVEGRCGVPAFHVPTNGMHDYARGAALAFETIASRMEFSPGEVIPRGVNVLGMTPLDFAAPGTRESLVAWLAGGGFELVSCWAMGDTLEGLAQSGRASLSLVVSVTGLRVARMLERRFGIPFVAGVPVAGFGEELAKAVEMALADGRSRVAYQGVPAVAVGGGELVAIGEPVAMGSVAAAARLGGQAAHVVCPLEDAGGLVCPGDVLARGEEEVERALAGASVVVGDPFYQAVCPADARFVRMPHLALSGRQWLGEVPNLIGWDDVPVTLFHVNG